jgi:16S rRNA (uracil1498-N3)-methyltransferase
VVAHPADHRRPFALVDDLEHPELGPGDRHHLERVLRMRTGDELVLGDGRGRWRPARLADPIEPTGAIETAPRAEPTITVAFALVKGAKPELVVQKLTELGVDRIVPFRARRSVVQWDADKAAKATERLRTVARAAAQQCHRPWLPHVPEVTDFGDLLDEDGVALADRTGAPPSLQRPTVLVGPEGGWAPEEREAAARSGVPTVALGPHVLRAETAALTAGAVLVTLRSALVREISPP